MSDGEHLQEFAVSATSETASRTRVEVRDLEFVVDEPTTLGGTNEGPTPVEYLLGTWAGCLNVVAHTVVEDYDFEIDDLRFELAGEFDPRKYLGTTDDVRAGYQEIRVEIDVEADADQETLEAFGTEVEDRCPVGDNIENPTPTDVTVARV